MTHDEAPKKVIAAAEGSCTVGISAAYVEAFARAGHLWLAIAQQIAAREHLRGFGE